MNNQLEMNGEKANLDGLHGDGIANRGRRSRTEQKVHFV